MIIQTRFYSRQLQGLSICLHLLLSSMSLIVSSIDNRLIAYLKSFVPTRQQLEVL